jgi:hypothetical protein
LPKVRQNKQIRRGDYITPPKGSEKGLLDTPTGQKVSKAMGAYMKPEAFLRRGLYPLLEPEGAEQGIDLATIPPIKLPGFTKATTDMPYYDNLLQNPRYFRLEKGVVGEIIDMTPTEYMQRQATVKGVKLSDNIRSAVDPKRVTKYAKEMKKGAEFPMLVLEPEKQIQEGLHRALAAQEAGLNKVPVLIVHKVKK